MSLAIAVGIKGVSAQQFEAFRENLMERIPRILDLIGTQVEGQSREKYLSGPRPNFLNPISGSLRRSVTHEVKGDTVNIGSNLPYAAIHEYGGTIEALRAPFLVFKTMDGRWHSMKSVKIPARPYLEPALQDSKPEIEKIVQSEADQAAKETLRG